jgi:hypothetical protein
MPFVLKIEETSSKISRRQLQIMSLQLVADVSEQEKTEATERLAKSPFALFPPVRKAHSWVRLRRAGVKMGSYSREPLVHGYCSALLALLLDSP